MKVILKGTHAKAQRRKEIRVSKAQTFFAPLRLCVSICLLFFAAAAMAETTNTLSDVEIQGRALAQKILEQCPATNSAQVGVLSIHDSKGGHTNISIKCEIITYPTYWVSRYRAFRDFSTNSTLIRTETLSFTHAGNLITNCFHNTGFYDPDGIIGNQVAILSTRGDKSFAGSDFWIADLGLEFFHWPQQKILKKEFRRNCSCAVLESTNPNPSPNGYSRVVSWIDEESGGIVMAEAYDAQGKLLKEFYPKDFKKVNGQWQVQSMQIENVQTGSRTRLEFDLNKN